MQGCNLQDLPWSSQDIVSPIQHAWLARFCYPIAQSNMPRRRWRGGRWRCEICALHRPGGWRRCRFCSRWSGAGCWPLKCFLDSAQMCRHCFAEHMRRGRPELPDEMINQMTACLFLHEECFRTWQAYNDPAGPESLPPLLQHALFFQYGRGPARAIVQTLHRHHEGSSQD
jgi:hypothetical protein